MTEITLDAIRPLIASHALDRTRLSVTFLCPETRLEVLARTTVQPQRGIGADAARQARQSFWGGIKRSVAGALRDTFGNGAVGKIAGRAAKTALEQQQEKTAFSQAELDAAMLAAFESVRSQFAWDAERGTWRGVPDAARAAR